MASKSIMLAVTGAGALGAAYYYYAAAAARTARRGGPPASRPSAAAAAADPDSTHSARFPAESSSCMVRSRSESSSDAPPFNGNPYLGEAEDGGHQQIFTKISTRR